MHIPPRPLVHLILLAALAVTSPSSSHAQAAASRHALVPLFNPTDLGLLESPDRDVWQKPDRVMDTLGIGDGSKVADIGAGGGYFTVRLARRVGPNGIVWANDVQAVMLEAIKRRMAKENQHNVQYAHGSQVDPMLPAGTLDAVLILETFQEIKSAGSAAGALEFLRNVRAALREGGRVGIVDYKKEGGGPGPDGPRPDPEEIVAVAEKAGLRLMKRETFLPFQFFLVFAK
jgi:ubiquinone/menaquinone biosynthesis C-methylase UbiE